MQIADSQPTSQIEVSTPKLHVCESCGTFIGYSAKRKRELCRSCSAKRKSVSRVTSFIIDYDLSLSHPSERRAFYRSVHKVLKSVTPETSPWSTASVLIVEDLSIAESIHALASRLGPCHIYEVLKIR